VRCCGIAVFDDLRQGVKNIEFLSDPSTGEVRVGSTAFLAASFVSAVVDRLSGRYPRIVFHLVTAAAGTLQHELSKRNVDLLIVRRFGSMADERVDFEFLFDDSFVVAVGAQNQWARRRRIELADLVNEPWVLPPPESSLASVAVEAFRNSGLDFPRATRVRRFPRGTDRSHGARAFSHNLPDVRIEVSHQALGDQRPACQAASFSRASRNRDSEEPYAQPRRANVHRGGA
jgi:DNA-binding transcriptional LysR family regulator